MTVTLQRHDIFPESSVFGGAFMTSSSDTAEQRETSQKFIVGSGKPIRAMKEGRAKSSKVLQTVISIQNT